MISYLLLPAVILCVVLSQPANITDELKNQTFDVFTYANSTTKPNNEAKSLNKEEFKEIEDELENNTAIIQEDNENFQDQRNELPHKHCQQDLLIELCHVYCGEPFHGEMRNIHTDEQCDLKRIIRPYNSLTLCLEVVAEFTGCFFPNPDIQDFFLYIHSFYFQKCTEKAEELFEDAPTSLVVALTIIPVSLIPVVVCVVLWKS